MLRSMTPLGIAANAMAGLAATAAIGPQASAQSIRVEPLFFANQPVHAIAAPGQPNRLYIVEQNGQIEILNLGSNTINPQPFLDIGPGSSNPLTFASGERGLLGLAFHPDYDTNGRFFVNYTTTTIDGSLDTVVGEFQVTGDDTLASNVQVAEIVRYDQDFNNHNGGDLQFGPDGMLYVASGDGGSARDPFERGQDPESLLGKMLRLDVDNPGGGYIPADNPFVGVAGFRDEIWALGVRNPFRFSFDRLTGDMYIGDVGQDTYEEINFQPGLLPDNSNIEEVGGLNYGWDCREGPIAAPASDRDCTFEADPGYVDPIRSYLHPDGCSITGGRVYRGTAIPELDGVYFLADFCSSSTGWIRSFRFDGSSVTEEFDWTETFGISSVVAFGEDLAGELYIVSIGGGIYKIVPDDGPCGCPCLLDGTEGLVFGDTFDTDKGWTVSSTASAGAWERGVPIDDPGWAYDPPTAADGIGGSAYVTQNTAGNSDVDNGTTTLTSPPLDLSVGAITICYETFYRTEDTQGLDGLAVELSSNGEAGPWTEVAFHQEDRGLVWTRRTITQADLDAANVTLTSDMRLRFIASDIGNQNIAEYGVDEIEIRSGNIPDCNGNGVDDADDIAMGTSEDCDDNGVPDECDIADGALVDAAGGLLGEYAVGEAFFTASCIGCHSSFGLGATGPNIRNAPRTTIRQRLTLEIFHPGGGFPNITDEELAALEAYLADGSSRARPDGVPDDCQLGLPDCDSDGTPDAQELEEGTQQDLNYDGVPDDCQPFCPGDLNGDLVTDVFDFADLATNFGSGPARFIEGDINGDGVVDVFDFGVLAGDFGCDQRP
jgi:glucose/arabinose dehydrogenase